ncbi:MAG: arabinan endo-1,5-alpha-L-arabinosidase [Tannerella sp.]|jgi:arabinan endo-1,5-alpha-L-arabinosidase|nr:arabinan endo-1,5-alpha-L-arabinosidase [Tannerella sp.]
MKNKYFPALLIGITLSACTHQAFKPIARPNPWKDDYTDISKMENYRQWGVYNVHDPAIQKFGDTCYMYSTDAIFAENRKEAREKGVPLGFVQMRKSTDLVQWDFVGWAFPEIPEEAVKWVRDNADGKGATNIWAPYIVHYKDVYRLYFCVSAFGKKSSYIGLAESSSPTGPWTQKGCVIKTNDRTPMNAIDPTIIQDVENGQWWMLYGSYFGGLYGVQLDPETGFTMQEDDRGHLVARRANYRKDNLEAPEIIYNPVFQKYYLFTSYDPLMTTYNIRAGRSDRPEGPFEDFFGKNLSDTTNNFPILTSAYRFDNHPGWAGVGHCGVVQTDSNQYFMVHQGRLSPRNALMVLHLRQIFFTPDGWPVVSPERYAATKPVKFKIADLEGTWEIIRILEPLHERNLEAGQVLWGEGELQKNECNSSILYRFLSNGVIENSGKWNFSPENRFLQLEINHETIDNLIVFAGQDWENQTETILFTGLDSRGRSVWGKRVQ